MHIKLIDIHKHYGGVRANDGVNLDVPPGSVHGVLGENGAGKSTLMKILAGYIRKTGGRILFDGREVAYDDPAVAARLGVGMLYQDPLDFPALTVLENFMLGQTRGLLRSADTLRSRVESFARKLQFNLHPDDAVSSLTIGERQQLEIIRLLSLGIQVLVLDEPTTGISSIQKEILFAALRRLAAEGKSVILVSHKLEDVEQLCDHVTVLRQGRVAGAMAAPFDASALLGMMFGQLPCPPECGRIEPGVPVLTLRAVSAMGGRTGLKNCSAVIRQREVVGLAGLEGSGQGVFLRVAAGLQQPLQGQVQFGEHALHDKGHHHFKRYGGAFVPTERLADGLISGLTISEHFSLQQAGGFWIDKPRAVRQARDRIDTFNIKGRCETRVESLSGGNQQRLLLSFLPTTPKLLLLENPTRGLDLESGHWVWRHLQKYCDADACIVFSSAELDEIMMVADRVLVFFDGRLIKDVPTCETSVEALGRAIAGKLD